MDPPRVLFVQTPDSTVRVIDHFEGMSDALLIPDLDYGDFTRRLGPREITVFDPDMVEQPLEFFEEVDYEHGGARHIVRLEDDVPTMVADFGMDSWSSRVRKVVGDIHRSLWRKANR